MITLIEDTNNKLGKHILKNKQWLENGITVERYRLPVGDYILMNDKVKDVIDRKAKRGIPVKMMDFMGCYDVACDSKNSILELCTDLQTEHQRFKDSLILAQNNGIKLYIVVENKGTYLDSRKTIWNEDVHSIKDLFKWKNPRAFIFRRGKQLYPNCAKGAWLAKCCMTMEAKYGCKFVFCLPEESARIITEILEGRYEQG